MAGRLVLRQHGVAVELVGGPGVFSAAAVDPGTAFLLRWLATSLHVRRGGRVLDLGCGYGPLALWLTAADPDRVAVAVDRDAVAVECTALGAAANGLGGRVEATGALGFDGVAGAFDLVVSNVPAKVGPAALAHLVLDGYHHLRPGGAMAVVVVDRLVDPVRALLADPAVEILEEHAKRGYRTWTYRFAGRPAGADDRPGFERGAYRRLTSTFGVGRLRWEATTSYTLAEFDTLAHDTVDAVELLVAAPLPGPVAVLGVGQGHTAAAVNATSGPDAELRLIDRDLLALRTAGANAGATDLRHVPRAEGHLAGCAGAVVALPPKQPVAVTADLLAPALAELPAGAPAVLHGRAADVSRVLDLVGRRGCGLAVVDRRGHAGHAAVLVATGD